MTKYIIDEEEWYPVLLPQQSSGWAAVEIPDDVMERYRGAFKEWELVQSILRGYLEASEALAKAYVEEHGCKELRDRSYFFGGYGTSPCQAILREDGSCPNAHHHYKGPS